MSEWIEHTAALQRLADAAPQVIGLDTEFMRINTFHPRLALVQVQAGATPVLVDPTVESLDPAPLAALLADPARTIIMHSAGEDLEALATWGCELATLYDTQLAAAFAGLGPGLGYQKLVATVLGEDLPKGETRSDWLRRPLSAKQLQYAAQDVEYLPALREKLDAAVSTRGFNAWLAEDCQRLLQRARDRAPDPQPQLALRSASGWPPERQAMLRRLLVWREDTARRIDRPRPWLLTDPHALELALDPPASLQQLAERTRGLRALRSAQREELHALLHSPLRDGELDIPPIPAIPERADKAAVAAMRQRVAAIAARFDLPEPLLASRRPLEQLVVSRRWPGALEGWRKELLHDELMPLLPGA